MAVACIDTNILIWGIQQVQADGKDDMIQRTTLLFERLGKEHTQIAVPAVVFGEFMVGLPLGDQSKYHDIIRRRFIVSPYDLRAAMYFSEITKRKKGEGVIQTLRAKGLGRKLIVADTMIVATAASIRAAVLYSNDSGIEALAKDFVIFEDIATMHFQLPLPHPDTET